MQIDADIEIGVKFKRYKDIMFTQTYAIGRDNGAKKYI